MCADVKRYYQSCLGNRTQQTTHYKRTCGSVMLATAFTTRFTTLAFCQELKTLMFEDASSACALLPANH